MVENIVGENKTKQCHHMFYVVNRQDKHALVWDRLTNLYVDSLGHQVLYKSIYIKASLIVMNKNNIYCVI